MALSQPTVLLVKPREDRDQQPLSRRARQALGSYPPLGLAHVAAALRRAAVPVRIVDVELLPRGEEDLAAEVRISRPTVVGIGAVKTLGWADALAASRAVKAAAPETVVVGGGPHFTLFARESLEVGAFDVVAIGDGEETIVELVRRCREPDSWGEVQGLAWLDHGELERSTARPFCADLDSLPFPALDLTELERYRVLTVARPFSVISSSRGCPYRCAFCTQVFDGNTLRLRSARNVAEEFALHVESYGSREIIVWDETFTADRKRVLEFCDLLLSRGVKVRWNIRTRVDTVDREMLSAMHRAGCRSVHMGVESGDPGVLLRMNKGITVERVEEAFREATEVGLETRGYFMLGYPGEGRAELDNTMSLVRRLEMDWVSFSLTLPLPHTRLFDEAEQAGLIDREFWHRFTREGGTSDLPYLDPPETGLEELKRLRAQAYGDFYRRGRFLARRLGALRSVQDVLEALRGLMLLAVVRLEGKS